MGKIYVFCPGDIISGGVNSLHILAKALYSQGYNVGMYYINPQAKITESDTVKSFGVPQFSNISDITENAIVIPETMSVFLNQYPHVKKIVYWLSVQYFFKTGPYRFPFNYKLLRNLIKYSWYSKPIDSRIVNLKIQLQKWNKLPSGIWNTEIKHITNSHFIAEVLTDYGIQKPYILHNPVRDEFYDTTISLERDSIILIGPKTKKSIISQIKRTFNTFQVIRVKRIEIQLLTELYKKSLLFIELGSSNRDRSIREAVLSGCILLVSNTGGCANNSDTPIPEYYKMNQNNQNKKELINRIAHICNNYKHHFMELENYRAFLKDERTNFNSNVKNIFDNIFN